MRIDPKLAHLLSDFCLDISKAYFITAFVSPGANLSSAETLILLLTRSLFNATLFLIFAWQFAKMGGKK